MTRKTYQKAHTPSVGIMNYDPCHSEFNYEMTITFNPRLYNRMTEFKAGPQLIQQINDWMAEAPYDITMTTFVMEYTASNRLHFHINISSIEPLPTLFRGGCLKGIERMFGRATFNDVADNDKWYEYLHKSLQTNYDTHGFIHYEQYFFYR